MLAKGMNKPHAFLTKQGVNRTTATRILRGNHKTFKIEYLELICWFLGCTPNEVLEWEPDKRYPNLPGHPLQAIRAQHTEMELPKLLKRLSKQQLIDLSNRAVDMLRENEGGVKPEG